MINNTRYRMNYPLYGIFSKIYGTDKNDLIYQIKNQQNIQINYSEIKPTVVQTKPIANIPQNTRKTVPAEIQSTQIGSNIVTGKTKIPEIIKGIER